MEHVYHVGDYHVVTQMFVSPSSQHPKSTTWDPSVTVPMLPVAL